RDLNSFPTRRSSDLLRHQKKQGFTPFWGGDNTSPFLLLCALLPPKSEVLGFRLQGSLNKFLCKGIFIIVNLAVLPQNPPKRQEN
ncbi:MAG TPA: hypothetical protein DCE07_02345, partial [Peptococcaceae bacterium]|nr:hypothetical protein [Peptococcaceae bacterium]